MAFPYDGWPEHRRAGTLSRRVLDALKTPDDYLTTDDAARFGVGKVAMRRCFSWLRQSGALRSDNTVRPAKYFLGEGLPITKKTSDNGVLLQALWSAAPTVQEDIS